MAIAINFIFRVDLKNAFQQRQANIGKKLISNIFKTKQFYIVSQFCTMQPKKPLVKSIIYFVHTYNCHESSKTFDFIDFPVWHLFRTHNTKELVTPFGVPSSFFFWLPRGDGIWTSRASLYDTLRVPLTFLHKPCSHSSIKTALKLQKRSGIHSAYTDGGILPARSNQAMLCANKSIIAKHKPERQITRSVFTTKPPDNERLCDLTGQ